MVRGGGGCPCPNNQPANPAQLHMGAPLPGIPSVTIQATTPAQPVQQQSHHDASPCMNHSQQGSFIRLAVGENSYQEIPSPKITAMQFTPEQGMSGWYRPVSTHGQDAARLVQLIDFENPQQTEAKPGAVITGIVKMTYSTSTGQQETRSFRLLGSSLLQDTEFPNIYYQATEELGRCIRN